jgi:hypothetical protein
MVFFLGGPLLVGAQLIASANNKSTINIPFFEIHIHILCRGHHVGASKKVDSASKKVEVITSMPRKADSPGTS